MLKVFKFIIFFLCFLNTIIENQDDINIKEADIIKDERSIIIVNKRGELVVMVIEITTIIRVAVKDNKLLEFIYNEEYVVFS